MFKNKLTIIGYVLVVVLMGGLFYRQASLKQEELKVKQQQEQAEAARKAKEKAAQPVATAPFTDSTATPVSATTRPTDSTTIAAVSDSAMQYQKYGAFAPASVGEEKLYTLETGLQKIVFTNKGGQIKSVELKKYKTSAGQPLILFTDKTNSLAYQLPTNDNQIVNSTELYFERIDSVNTTANDSNPSITLRANIGGGKYFEQKYSLKANSYLLDYDVNLVGLNSIIPTNYTALGLKWDNALSKLEKNLELERRYSVLYFRDKQGEVGHLDEDKEDDEQTPGTQLEWISYKQQFFNTTLFTKTQFGQGPLKTHFLKDDTNYVKRYSASLSIPFNRNNNQASYAFQFYIGPNHYNTLSAMDKDVENIIKLGPNWWPFAWIKYITHFIIWVFSWFDSVHLNYGIIILLMTLMLKLALHPLTAKSIESAAKMKILAPELAALREKYGDDQAKMGGEQMKLYQKAGVSPFGGCLPLLLQMPILMAMYYFFPASIELRQEPFLWATDLSSYDAIVTFSPALPLGITHISLFTILMTITSILQAVMNNQMNAMANQQPGMKYMPYFMPVLLMFMFNSFPAALTYYYLLQNLLGVGHQWVIQKFFINEEKLRKQIEEHKKNPKPVSSWQKKLSEMQRNAQQGRSGQPTKKQKS